MTREEIKAMGEDIKKLQAMYGILSKRNQEILRKEERSIEEINEYCNNLQNMKTILDEKKVKKELYIKLYKFVVFC